MNYERKKFCLNYLFILFFCEVKLLSPSVERSTEEKKSKNRKLSEKEKQGKTIARRRNVSQAIRSCLHLKSFTSSVLSLHSGLRLEPIQSPSTMNSNADVNFHILSYLCIIKLICLIRKKSSITNVYRIEFY